MSNWINGNLIGSLSVGQGERGKSIEYMWRGTELGIRQEGEEEYQFVDLANGGVGTNGREVELQVGSGYIQWRYKGEDEWKNLIAIADLKGEKGDQGLPGADGRDGNDGENGKSLEFEWRGTELGIKREDSKEFQYTNLKGEKGEKGDTGEKGKDGIVGKDGKSLEFNWDDTSLGIRVQGDSDYKYVNLKGQQGEQGTKGDKGETGQKGDKGDQGLQGEKGQDGRDGITPNIKIGNVTSVESSETPSVTIRGDQENPILDFSIPKGVQGTNGQDGTNGENGKSLEYNWNGTQLGVKREDENSYNYVDLKGRDGVDGKQGPKGEQGDNGVFVGDVNDAPESANIVVDDSDEGLFFEGIVPEWKFLKEINLKEEVAKLDITELNCKECLVECCFQPTNTAGEIMCYANDINTVQSGFLIKNNAKTMTGVPVYLKYHIICVDDTLISYSTIGVPAFSGNISTTYTNTQPYPNESKIVKTLSFKVWMNNISTGTTFKIYVKG